MDEHEKERIRKELRELDDLADKYGGYVVQTLPGDITEEDDQVICESLRKDKERNRMKISGKFLF